MTRYGMRIGLMALVLCQAAMAQEAGNKPTSQPTVVSLADKQALDANMNRTVVVEGLVADARWSTTGQVFSIRFKDGGTAQFQAVIFAKTRDAMEKTFGNLTSAFEGANIRLTGRLQTYRGHPEIVINDPKQVSIVTKGSGSSPQAAAAAQPAVRLSGPYEKLTGLTDEQRTRIAAIQKEALALEKKVREDSAAKIDPLLTEEQKQQLKSLEDAARNSSGGDPN